MGAETSGWVFLYIKLRGFFHSLLQRLTISLDTIHVGPDGPAVKIFSTLQTNAALAMLASGWKYPCAHQTQVRAPGGNAEVKEKCRPVSSGLVGP